MKWRPTGPALDLRSDSERKRVVWLSTLTVLSLCSLTLLVQRFEAPLVLGGVLVALGGAALLARPGAATILTVFLLYVNFPAILTKRHDVPDVIAGAFILLLAIPLAHQLFSRGGRVRASSTFWLMVAFLGVLLLSSVGAVEPLTAAERVLQFAFEGLLLYWLVINVVRDRHTLRRCIWTLLAAGSLLSGLSLYQDVTGSYQQEFGGLAYRNYVVSSEEEGEDTRRRRNWERAQGSVDEPNRFAQIMIVLVPLAVLSLRAASSRAARLCAVAAGLLIFAGISITLSRGAFVALIILGAAMVYVRWLRPGQAFACLAALVFSISIVSPEYIPRMLSIVNVKHLTATDKTAREQADGAMRGRTTSMLTAVNVFRENVLLGVGPDQFRFHYMDTYRANPNAALRDNIRQPRRAHSLYLEIAAEQGIVGLTVFMAILLLLMRDLWRMRGRWLPHSVAQADLATAFWLSLLTYMTTGVFLHLSYQRYLWFLLAMAGAALYVLRGRPDEIDAFDAGLPAAPVATPSLGPVI